MLCHRLSPRDDLRRRAGVREFADGVAAYSKSIKVANVLFMRFPVVSQNVLIFDKAANEDEIGSLLLQFDCRLTVKKVLIAFERFRRLS